MKALEARSPADPDIRALEDPPQASEVVSADARGRRPTAERRRRKRRETIIVRSAQLVLLVAFFAAWEGLSGRPGASRWVYFDEFYTGKPSKSLDTLREWWSSGALWDNTSITLYETAVGFAIGCVSGIAVGFLLGVNRWLSRVFGPFVTATYAIPRLALGPLFFLWFGLGPASKVALVTTVVFFLVFFNTLAGVKEVDQDLIDVLRLMGASRFALHTKVTLPSAATWVIAGLRISVPYAFVAAVVGEMLAAQRGLGALMQRAASNFNPSALFAAVAVLVFLALCLNALVQLLERKLVPWKAERADD